MAIFKAEKVVHENRILAVRNAEARGSIPPLLHHLFSSTYSYRRGWLFLSCDAVVTCDLKIKSHGLYGSTFVALGASHIPSSHADIRVAHELCNGKAVVASLAEACAECGPQIMPPEPFDSRDAQCGLESLLDFF